MSSDAGPEAAGRLRLPNATASNLTRALKAAGTRGIFIGFTAVSCIHCVHHEAVWGTYLASTSNYRTELPLLLRVDSDRESKLLRRHEVVELPALVLAWPDRSVTYTGPHTHAAMVAFGEAQLTPPAVELSQAALLALLDEQKTPPFAPASEDEPSPPAPLLLLGFFNDPHDGEADEVDDLVNAATELRKHRPDAPVRGAYVTLTSTLSAMFVSDKRWIDAAPSAVLLAGGVPTSGASGSARGGAFRLDEHDATDKRTLSEWAMQMALPDVGELTPLTFAAYAATNLPMLIAFVDPTGQSPTTKKKGGKRSKGSKGGKLDAALKGVASRFRGKLCVVTCDGVEQRTRMITLGLDADAPLPQFAINTKDDRKLPFPIATPPTEKALAIFAADFLGERLPPKPKRDKGALGGADGAGPAAPPRPAPPEPPAFAKPGDVVDLTPANFDRVALDVTKDVLLMLTADVGCEGCQSIVPYYAKVGARVRELGLAASLTITRFDVKKHADELPAHLAPVQLHNLPILLMLPAKRKDAPFTLYHGTAKTKPVLYFAQKHASFAFDLPPNPHLTREQHAAWKEQVAELPKEKVDAAYAELFRETGLTKDEL